jgi:hypothetical protein
MLSCSTICERLPPQVGYYEIVKFLDPRLLNISFKILDDIEWNYPKFQRFSYVDKDDNYKFAHDLERNPISKSVHIHNRYGVMEDNIVYLCQKMENNVKIYYIAYVVTKFENPPCNCRSECGNCYEEVGYMYMTYEYASHDLETAIFKYLDISDDEDSDY